MPKDPATDLLKNLILINRIANGISQDAADRLRDLFDELAALIVKVDPTAVQSRYQQDRVERIMEEAAELVGPAFDDMRKDVRAELAKLAVQQTDAMIRTLGTATDFVADLSSGDMSINFAKRIIDRNPFQGSHDTARLFSEWVELAGQKTVNDVRARIQVGMLNNEDIGSLVRRVRGRSNGRGGFTGGVLESSTRDAEAIVRTAVNDIANTAHQMVYRANANVVTHLEWTAALDVRVCPYCAALDGRRWAIDDPAIRRPPIHFNDRCVMVPIIDWEGLGLTPPDEGTRSARNAAGKSVQVSAGMDFGAWLKTMPIEQQEEVLGKGKARLFRQGRVSLKDLIRRDGSIVRLDELEVVA